MLIIDRSHFVSITSAKNFRTRSNHIFGNNSPTQRSTDSIDASFEPSNYCASTNVQ